MAKNKAARKKAVGKPWLTAQQALLTVHGLPKTQEPPAAVLALSDPLRRDAATDAWRAAWTLRDGIDTWQTWYLQLKNTGDADPGVLRRLSENCSAAIFALCALKPFAPTFREHSADELVAMLPPDLAFHVGDECRLVQYGKKGWQKNKQFPEETRMHLLLPFAKGWQKNKQFLEDTRARLSECVSLQGSCWVILSQLKEAPSTALGWAADDNGQSEETGVIKLKQSQQDLVDTIREAGQRLTKDEILQRLSDPGPGPSEGTTKIELATLVQFKVLTQGNDSHGKGYGLPVWSKVKT